MSTFFTDLLFLTQRLDWQSVLDLFLVTLIFFGIMMLIQDTQAMVLLRGVIFIVIFLSLLTNVINLPAFSWLIRTALPGMVIVIPVVFAPEIRRGLERLGRVSSGSWLSRSSSSPTQELQKTIQVVVTAATRLAAKNHGALIIMQRSENLGEYVQTGVRMNAVVTPELLLQVFYPNTPLHDGAAIIANNRLVAAACVMPLSASGILNRSVDRQMGLRHRAALGISEASDAIAVVVSEETGRISIAHAGRMIRRLDADRLANILLAFYRPTYLTNNTADLLTRLFTRRREEKTSEE